MMKRSTRATMISMLLAVGLIAAACSDDSKSSTTTSATDSGATETTGATGSTAPAAAGLTVGFIYVGPKDDFGYNQAAYDGSLVVKKTYPNVKVLEAENVPETAEAEAVMQGMIDKGAKLIFATSYGHLEFAENLAAKNPSVTFVHQGGLEATPKRDNIGTYFGTVYEPVYTAGIAAASVSKTGVLGYVYAFPIPQTLANINAFTLGAQSVNPKIKTIAVSTGSWCDPALQASAAKSLITQGADVLTQHQDCTKTIIEAAEKAGIYTVGYHADASSLAPKGWITGSQWNWGPMYNDIVKTVLDGKFASSPYNGDYRVGLQTGDNPFIQSAFGSMVTVDVKAKIDKARAAFVAGGSPFAGPVLKQDGSVVWAAGKQPTYAEVETMDFFVKGVVGSTK